MPKLKYTSPGVGFLDTRYVKHNLSTAANDFLVGSGSNTYIKRTLAETGAILEADIDHGNIQGLDTGADHSYIDQDVTSGSGPAFTSATLTTPAIGVATGTSLDLGGTTLLASRSLTIDTGGVFDINLGTAAGDDFTIDTSAFVVEGDTGNVGIGTTGPQTRLQVTGTSLTGGMGGFTGTNQGILAVEGDAYTAGDTVAIDFTTPTHAGPYARIGAELENSGSTLLFGTTTTYASGILTTAMAIGPTGNVGIGTTGPASKLHIASNDANTFLRVGNSNRYRTDLVMNNAGSATLNSYDDTGTVYMPLRIDAIKTVLGMRGNVGIGTTSPTNILSLGGESARIFWMERELTADTAGNTLTITAGGATSGATDKAGGALILQGGLSTGSAESGVTIQGVVAGASGTADRTQTTAIQVLGNKIGFFAQTPVVRQTELTDELTTITHTAPGTPDYAIQNLTNSSPFGFVTADEGNTALSVIANLQARVNELETKLTAYGLLIDAD